MSGAVGYAELGREIGALVEEKRAAYGDSFGKSGEVMRILYPDGIGVDQYNDALTVVRILDKLFRIATDRDAMGESPYRDIAGYGILGARRVATAKALRDVVAEVKSATNPRDPDVGDHQTAERRLWAAIDEYADGANRRWAKASVERALQAYVSDATDLLVDEIRGMAEAMFGRQDPEAHPHDLLQRIGRDALAMAAARTAAGEGYGLLTFAGLRAINRKRCEAPKPHGFGHALNSWSVAEWSNAAAGEAGEACNIAKKLLRVRSDLPGNRATDSEESLREALAAEIADAVTYLDLLAASEGIDLGAAVARKFNEISARIGSHFQLHPMDGSAGEVVDAPIPYRVTPQDEPSKDDERVVLTRAHYDELEARAKANAAAPDDGIVRLNALAYTNLLTSAENAKRNAEREMAEVVRLTDRVRELTVANAALKEQVDPMKQSRLDAIMLDVRREEREFWADRFATCFPWPLSASSNGAGTFAESVIAALRTNNRRWPESKTP